MGLFFLDQFGNLIKKWDAAMNAYEVRAQSTCDYVKIDRDEIQTRRRSRMKNLKRSVEQALGEYRRGEMKVPDLSKLMTDWLTEPFQSDVGDYFFRGPGRQERPFADLLALGVVVPPL